jgi:hypothetical protein
MEQSRIPKIETIDNCTLEIDRAKGTIKVSVDGRIKVVVKRIAIGYLCQPMIELVSDNGLERSRKVYD